MEQLEKYIDVKRLQDDITKIYLDSFQEFQEEDKEALRSEGFDDDYIKGRARDSAMRLSRDFVKYCHKSDTNILGNFNDITPDTERRFKVPLKEVLSQIESNQETEITKAFPGFAVEWFFLTFGTAGLAYNFKDEINERLYQIEKYKD